MINESALWAAAERVMSYGAGGLNIQIGLGIGAFVLLLVAGIFFRGRG